MLDVDHPRAPETMEAARLEELIRRQLLRWCEEEVYEPVARAQLLQILLPKLDALNARHFGASKKIARTLEALRVAVQRESAASAWLAFQALEGPGDNFGTWAI